MISVHGTLVIDIPDLASVLKTAENMNTHIISIKPLFETFFYMVYNLHVFLSAVLS